MINPPSSVGHKWFLTTMDYFTRWTMFVPLKEATESVILNFLEEIITRFGIPQTINFNNAKYFLGSIISYWALRLGIYLKNSSNYYSQGNGLEESTNKKLIRTIKRTMDVNQR